MANDVFALLLRSQMSRRLLFTAGILLVYRLGCQVPIPGLDTEALSRLSNLLKTETVSVLALGVTPFLSALLVFEFVKLIIPPLARWETANASKTNIVRRQCMVSPGVAPASSPGLSAGNSGRRDGGATLRLQ